MIITDAVGCKTTREGNVMQTSGGYYMDGYLKENLDTIPILLSKAWDVVGIISGHGKVRIGKSTLALQVAYYLAWILAGGVVEVNDERKVVKIIPPTKPLKFDLDNVVFSPDELMKAAQKLPAQSVIVYDEGRAGLDSKRAMEAINKTLEDFFQECGIYNHVILIVLPNFFRLHEDYAVARSFFLLDVYADKEFNRGFFKFYNELKKEQLYYFGKKKIGIRAKYGAAYDNFFGRFTSWLPFSKEDYENKKLQALRKKKVSNLQIKFKKQRDAAIYLAKNYSERTHEELASELSAMSNSRVTAEVVKRAIATVTHKSFEEIG